MASRFWVGGTGTWDSTTTTHWALTTGAAGGASAPTTGDTVTFDGSSGGGTVTVDSTINGLSLVSITCGAFTGTLDFSVNNPSMTLTTQFSVTGAGARVINLGSGTFTFTGTNTNNFDATVTTSLTPTFGNATFLFNNPTNGNSQNLIGGGLSYGTLSVANRTNGSIVQVNGSNTFATILAAGKSNLTFVGATTTTVTNALNINPSGSASSVVLFVGSSVATAATISVAALSVLNWCVIKGITFTTNTPVASNSFDLGNNTNVTINTPAAGSGGAVIGS